MRILVVLRERDFGDFLDSGALFGLDGPDTYYVSSRLKHAKSRTMVEARPTYLGTIEGSAETDAAYGELERLTVAAKRSRCFSLDYTTRALPARQRRRAELSALPIVRGLASRRAFRRAGLNEDLHALMQRIEPDLVITGALWDNSLGFDALRAARALGIASLTLITHWDGLSLVGGFVMPDYLGVWGEQSVDHAEQIHGFPREHVFTLGSPRFEFHFRERAGTAGSPFPFRYVLFTGTHARFDELEPLERLNQAIDDLGLDLKIVYRPYPARLSRDRSDFVDESRLRNVVIDPQVRDDYLATFGERKTRETPFDLAWLTPLLANAEFLVSPLTTLMVEGALFDKPVIALAYEDGLHYEVKRSDFLRFDILAGMDRVFRIVRERDDVTRQFTEVALQPPPPPGALRDHEIIRWWLFNDGRPYSERVVDAVRSIARERGFDESLVKEGVGISDARAAVALEQLGTRG